jgi:hypothetical protein
MNYMQAGQGTPAPPPPPPAPVIAGGAGTIALEANVARLEAMVERMTAGADRMQAAAEQMDGPARQSIQTAAGALREQAEAARAQLAEAQAALEAAREGSEAASRFTYTTGAPFPPIQSDIPPGVVTVSLAFFVMVAVVAVGIPLARAFARRMDRRSAQPEGAAPEGVDRLQRIEQAVDAIAIEVERVSEGQRYTTKVVSELRALPSPDVAERAAVDRLEARGAEAGAGAGAAAKPGTQ